MNSKRRAKKGKILRSEKFSEEIKQGKDEKRLLSQKSLTK